tara:strand:+ start:461 stop:574 length:114 start_codon:yes stop_codon:yes gene_type:complete
MNAKGYLQPDFLFGHPVPAAALAIAVNQGPCIQGKMG